MRSFLDNLSSLNSFVSNFLFQTKTVIIEYKLEAYYLFVMHLRLFESLTRFILYVSNSNYQI